MKLLMDFRKYDNVIGGVEQLVVQIVRHACTAGHSVIVLARQNRAGKVEELFADEPNVTVIALPVDTHAFCAANRRLDSGMIQEIAAREQCDVIHFPYNWAFPANKAAPCVLTIHDVIPFTFREAMPLLKNLFYYKPAIRRACRMNDIITTVSDFSADDIAEKVGVPRNKIRVINNGCREPNLNVDENVVKTLFARLNLGDDFILNVGGIHERKNIPRLIKAFAGVHASGYKGKLVITGRVKGAKYQDSQKRLCDRAVVENNLEGRVCFTGFITEDELDALMTRARLLVYPSLYEGFGLPIIEAMKAKLPVITSSITAMPGVAGDAAMLVDPTDVKAITDGMNRLMIDDALRKSLVEKGIKRAAAFSWDRSAGQYLDLFARLSAGSGQK